VIKMDIRRKCDTLILLVGSNPLPNYITARILEPKNVVLLYTPQTKDVAQYLESNFREISIDVLPPFAVDGADPRSTRDVLMRVEVDNPKTFLNYTGGTKVMAAHARMAFRERGGSDSQASYLDEREGVLRFDDGYEIHLKDQSDLDLTIERIARLHGIKVTPDEYALSPEKAREIATEVLKNPALKGQYGPSKWLEVLVADLISEITGSEPKRNLHCEFIRSENKREFEIDVSVIRGHRLYVVSCTTSGKSDKSEKDNKVAKAKSKLFEVAIRSRQLGGDLARSALVCLVDLVEKGDNKGLYIDQLAQDVESVWDSPNKPRVFGAAHLREWLGLNAEPNLDSLKEWLES